MIGEIIVTIIAITLYAAGMIGLYVAFVDALDMGWLSAVATGLCWIAGALTGGFVLHWLTITLFF